MHDITASEWYQKQYLHTSLKHMRNPSLSIGPKAVDVQLVEQRRGGDFVVL